jgi:formylglycine-generating enzyme required for sulfatase activity
MHTLTQSVEVPNRKKLEDRLRSLLATGVKPVGPFWTNSVGMKFAWVPAGTYWMGSPAREQGRQKNETQHRVTLTKGFFLAVHAVTQSCWRAVMGNNPSHHQGDDLPVERVSREDCQEFLGKLSESDGHAYRLPTEAEWEYSCRAGTTTPFYFGKTISTEEANFNGNYPYGKGKKGVYRGKTTSVGSFPANAFGLHDTHGNVWEWCQDWFGDYPTGDAVDPQGPPEGDSRVLRGGSFIDLAMTVRSALRLWDEPSFRDLNVGFRAARTFTP